MTILNGKVIMTDQTFLKEKYDDLSIPKDFLEDAVITKDQSTIFISQEQLKRLEKLKTDHIQSKLNDL